MSGQSNIVSAITDAIQHGTFPQSEEILSTELTEDLIRNLLEQLNIRQHQTIDKVKTIMKDHTEDVDSWIAKARLAQEKTAQIKVLSRKLVEDHKRIQAVREERMDRDRKNQLIEKEIKYLHKVKQRLLKLRNISMSFDTVRSCLSQEDPFRAASELQNVHTAIASLPKPKSRTSVVCQNRRDELCLKTRIQLEARLNEQIQVRRDQEKGWIEVQSSEVENGPNNSDTILHALDIVGESYTALEPVTARFTALIRAPLRRASRLKISGHHQAKYSIIMDLSHQNPTLDVVFNFVFSLIQFIHSSLRKKVQLAIVGSLFPDVITLLLDEWVNPSLPNDISELDKLEGIKRQVDLILDQLKTFKWPGHTELQTWKDQLNRTWLNQRKSASLDSVRKALASAKGGLRQVERVEKQMMAAQAQVHHHDPEEDNVDWDASWEEEEKQKVASPTAAKSTNDNEEDASGWGFDDDDDTTENVAEDNKKQAPEDDDAGDAWGWGDDEQEEQKTQEDSSPTTKRTNGSKKEPVTEEEVVLREHYSITEVPDHLLEIIGRDIADAQALQATENNHLDTAIAARGLLALPTLALAMFRATAPSYYGASPALTDIHRYNDSLYIAEKLRDLGPDTSIYNISADIEAMEKFARLAYAKEMETQRVIIWDLLEGAQGFTSCTQFPYSQEIENAVSSVVDRIRTLHREWQPILSPSALSQSIGAMLAMVIGKVIHSIEEMDDISEPESHRLTAFCQQIASLDDLFHQTPPFDTNITGTGSTPASVSLTAVYVPSWLRFQYLINILESSLVDIKYLWTEGELSLEFSQREVVSLIQALFTESTHRRNAINAVLGKKGPLDRQEY